jgi:cytoskeletal protein CcmA (bactofilin family)
MMTAAGLQQYSAIQNEPEPEFRLGTRLVGPSHEAGGIGIYGKGKYYGEAEGDELIMTKGVYRDPVGRRLASDLNAAFGGVRFDGYNSTSTPPRFSFGSVISGSGYTSTRTDTVMMEQRLAMQEEYMLIMAGEIKAIKETPVEAYMSYDMFIRKMEAVDIARKR